MHAYKKTYTRTGGTGVEGCEDMDVREWSSLHQTLTPAPTHLCGIYMYMPHIYIYMRVHIIQVFICTHLKYRCIDA